MDYYGTLGPACADRKTLEEMFQAGMTGIRLNLSHGDLEKNRDWLELVCGAAKACGKQPKLLIDLQGPELRLGHVEQREILEGTLLRLGEGGIPVPEMLLNYTEAGDHLLIDDGKLELLAEAVLGDGESRAVSAKVLRGGVLLPEKSLAVVGKELPLPTLTEADKKNLRLAARAGVTGVMLPFVRSREDLLALGRELQAAGASQIEIFAKIENLQGVLAIHELIPHCDHIVIARGDLGNAMPLWELPGVQKFLAAACKAAGMPFMVVTQMLDSMHTRAVPTRAEVSDIYNAVLDGASSVMLTGETAAGRYPAKAMEYLVRTGEEARKALAGEAKKAQTGEAKKARTGEAKKKLAGEEAKKMRTGNGGRRKEE